MASGEEELLSRLARRDLAVPDVVEALVAVRTRRSFAALPAVLSWLRDADLTIVDAACGTIAALGSREAIPELLDLLRPEAEVERRIDCAVDPFGWYEPPPRESAALALGALGAREAIPLLLKQLADELAGPRAAAATALATLGATEARGALARLQADPEPFVREAAVAALARLLETVPRREGAGEAS